MCHQWKLSNSAECPLCSQQDETWTHVLQCPNIHVSRLRTEQIHKLSKDLNHHKLVSSKRTASKPINVPPLSFTFPMMQFCKAHNDQIQIGMQSFSKK